MDQQTQEPLDEKQLIADLQQQVEDGLITEAEAGRLLKKILVRYGR